MIDQDLQNKLKRGSEKVLELYFDQYYTLLCSVAYQYVRDEQISESIASDVFFTLWKKREEILPIASLKAYLLRSVRNRAIDYLRSVKNTLHIDIQSSENTSFIRDEDVFEKYIQNELENKINEEINKLPLECKTVFCLSRNEGKSYSEISQELNISVNTVKYHIKNALSILRKELQDYILIIMIFYFMSK